MILKVIYLIVLQTNQINMITKKQWKDFILKYEFLNVLERAPYIRVHLKGAVPIVDTGLGDRILSITEVSKDLLAVEILRYSFSRGFNRYHIMVLPFKRKTIEAIFYSDKSYYRSDARKTFRKDKKR